MAKNPIRPWFAKRLTELWNVPSETTPVQVHDGRFFFERNSGLQNQSVLYVQDSPSAKPRALIDPNIISPDGSTALSRFVPSPDGRLVAYALSPGGSDQMDIHVLDVATGKQLPDVVRWLKASGVAWTKNERGFFYSRYPEPPKGNEIDQEMVHETVYYHALGTPQSADRLIYARPESGVLADRPDCKRRRPLPVRHAQSWFFARHGASTSRRYAQSAQTGYRRAIEAALP